MTPTNQLSSGMQRMQQALNTAAVCEACGGTYFSEIILQEYRDGYSSGIGGDFSPLSEGPQTVLKCACGHLRRPNIGGVRGGKTPNKLVNGVMDALNKAKLRHSTLPNLVSQCASKQELTALEQKLEQQGQPGELVAVAVPGLEQLAAEVEQLKIQLEGLVASLGAKGKGKPKTESRAKLLSEAAIENDAPKDPQA